MRIEVRTRAPIHPVLATALTLGIATVLVLSFPVALATGSNSQGPANTYSQPTWWEKFLVVSTASLSTAVTASSSSGVRIGSNIDVSNEPGPQSETSIAVNPENPKQIVAGSNEIFRLPMRGYFSADGGKTWSGVDLPLPPNVTNSAVNFGSDPGVAWDTKGNVYYVYIIVFFNLGFDAVTATEMAVARSSDAGQTWVSTYFALENGSARFNDKPMITVDTSPTSPFLNRIYVAWDRFAGASSANNGILSSFSSDGGRTFSTPVFASSVASGPKGDIGADPFTSPDGTLHVAWHDVQNNLLVVASSTNGGASFGPTRLISQTAVAFDVGIPAMATRRALLYPACGADLSSGAHRGTLYCNWMDETSASGTDIFLSRSLDNGVTWSAKARVNDDPTGVANDQFNQWLSVDPTTGTVWMTWQDTRNDPTHLSTDVFGAFSSNGGLSFSPNFQVTTAPTNEAGDGADLGNQYGDYEGNSAFGGIDHPVWTDRRTSVASLDEEVFTATVQTT
jgi:hypothetical protein